MNDTKILIEKIKEGIQEKKGKNIIIADLTSIEDTICKYFVICQGNSPSPVSYTHLRWIRIYIHTLGSGSSVGPLAEIYVYGTDKKP